MLGYKLLVVDILTNKVESIYNSKGLQEVTADRKVTFRDNEGAYPQASTIYINVWVNNGMWTEQRACFQGHTFT